VMHSTRETTGRALTREFCTRLGRSPPSSMSAVLGPERPRAALAARRAARDGPLDRSETREAERLGGGAGEVPFAAGDVGPAVDDRDGDRAAVVAERDERAAGRRLVRHAELRAAEHATAREPQAVVGVHRGDALMEPALRRAVGERAELELLELGELGARLLVGRRDL